MIRYANDIELTELARFLTNQMADMNALLREGYLNVAFNRASEMTKGLEKLKDRINTVQFSE